MAANKKLDSAIPIREVEARPEQKQILETGSYGTSFNKFSEETSDIKFVSWRSSPESPNTHTYIHTQTQLPTFLLPNSARSLKW